MGIRRIAGVELDTWCFVLGEFQVGSALWLGDDPLLLPQSGYVAKPRVASTLGNDRLWSQPGTGCAHGRNRVAVESRNLPNPG